MRQLITTMFFILATTAIGCRTPRPRIMPVSGIYACPQTIIITDKEHRAGIRYTTDGSVPSASSSNYTGPFLVADTSTVKAEARADDQKLSKLGAATITCQPQVNRADFGLLLQEHFTLPQPKHPVSFSDVRPTDLIYPAAESLAPLMHRDALCAGCQLSANFSPNKPTSRAESAIILVSILVAANKLSLLSPASANAVLAGAPDVGGLPLAARPYIATAIQNGILTLLPGNTIQPAAPYTHPDLMAALETINTTFGAFPVPAQ